MLQQKESQVFQGLSYIENINNETSYLTAKVLTNISATLCSIKPASLITFSRRRDKDLIKLWDKHKVAITLEQNIEFIELKRGFHYLVVLFYHRRKLTKQLSVDKHLRFLARFGYSKAMSCQEMLGHLQERYQASCPHEIGIFLGIPLQDVLGFLELVPLECTYRGYWKVYGDPTKSIQRFQCYRKLRQEVITLISGGLDPDDILIRPSQYLDLKQLYATKPFH